MPSAMTRLMRTLAFTAHQALVGDTKKHISNKKEDCRKHMLAALYARRSEETCLESVDTAIECAGSEELKVYITRYWRSYT